MANPPPQIRAVFFDLGGTLVDERDYLGWTDTARRHYLEFEPDDLAHAFRDVESEMDGVISDHFVEFWQKVLAQAAQHEVSLATATRFTEDIHRQRAPYRLFSDSRRCLEELREDGRRLGVISNSNSEASARRVLDQTGILELFDTVTSSGTEGVRKPDPEIFRRALARAKVSVHEAFYVGNLLKTDALAARAAGIPSVWLHRDGVAFNEDPPEVTSLLEVPNWVRRLEGSPEKYPARRR